MLPLTPKDYGFAVISRFEETTRAYIQTAAELQFDNPLSAIPSGVIDKSLKRMSPRRKELSSILRHSDFSDFKDIFSYGQSFTKFFPNDELEPSQCNSILDILYDHRCRIDHSRDNYTEQDLTSLINFSCTLASHMETQGACFIEDLDEIRNATDLSIYTATALTGHSTIKYNVPNNIPTPDYTLDGGFIGRSTDVQKVLKIVKSDRYRVITISGAGGVGKTALAHRVVHSIAKDINAKLDGVIWVSAKEDMLTPMGIEDIEPSIKNYGDLLDAFLTVLNIPQGPDATVTDKEEAVEKFLDHANKALLIIDNLETITDLRIREFILDAHPSLLTLVTSRKGLGEVERRHELKQLSVEDATILFRVIAREKHLTHLEKLPAAEIEPIVTKLTCYPLAIKWVLGHVATGKELDDIITGIAKTESDISKFCFERIFKELSINVRSVLYAITLFDEPVSTGTLTHMTDLSKHELEDAIAELLLLSLVIQEQITENNAVVKNKYTILPLTRGFLSSQLDADLSTKSKLIEKFTKAQAYLDEAQQASRQYSAGLSNYDPKTTEEYLAAMYAQTGVNYSTTGYYEEACQSLKKATEIAPNLHTVYRAWAIVETNEEHYIEADRLFEKSISLRPDDTFTLTHWGYAKKKRGQIQEALGLYERALKLDPNNPKTLGAYAHCLTRKERYEEAVNVFEKLLSITNADNEHVSTTSSVINHTAFADSYRRWAEECNRLGNNNTAEKLISKSQEHISTAINLMPEDSKSRDVNRKINLTACCIHKSLGNDKELLETAAQILVKNPVRYKDIDATFRAIIHITQLAIKHDKLKSCTRFYTPRYQELVKKIRGIPRKQYEELAEIVASPRLTGTIIKIDDRKNFMIIQPDDNKMATHIGFFSNFHSQIQNDEHCFEGKPVIFTSIKNIHKGTEKLKATYIKFAE